jgi:hypothetical protein
MISYRAGISSNTTQGVKRSSNAGDEPEYQIAQVDNPQADNPVEEHKEGTATWIANETN